MSPAFRNSLAALGTGFTSSLLCSLPRLRWETLLPAPYVALVGHSLLCAWRASGLLPNSLQCPIPGKHGAFRENHTLDLQEPNIYHHTLKS